MRTGPIILLVCTAAVVGWFGPDLRVSRDRVKETVASAGTSPPQSSEVDRAAWLTGSTVLDRMKDGHFYADADVDAGRVHFLVDTGASVVVLTGNDARAVGLHWDDSELKPIGRGASGTVYGVPVLLERIEIDGFEARSVQAAIIPEGLDVSLLGQSFLTQLRGVQIEGDTMTLNAES